MNDSELKSILKSSPVPERADEYWEDFPARMRIQLQRPSAAPARPPQWQPRLAWAGSMAMAVALVFLFIEFQPLKAASLAIDQHKHAFDQQLARLDTGLHRLVLNTDGMGYLLADSN